MEKNTREIVVPGEIIGDGDLKPGIGTYRDKGKIYASQLGVKNIRSGYINIVALAGKYSPSPGDAIIGKIIDIGPTNWLVDIKSPYPAPLRVNEVPWKVDFGDTKRYLNVGDIILAKILSVDETKRVQVTMKEHGLRKLFSGQIVEIPFSKVPRVIGRNGSMISLIKKYTKCQMFVGQNGRIWLDGDTNGIANAIQAIKKIEAETQIIGLTDSIRELLENLTKEKKNKSTGEKT